MLPLAFAAVLLAALLVFGALISLRFLGEIGWAGWVFAVLALVLEAAVPGADEVFHLVALTIVLSILAHSSTDILVARSFERPPVGLSGSR